MSSNEKYGCNWATLLPQYVLAIIGIILASKIAAMIVGIISFDLGLHLTLLTLLMAVTLCIEFFSISYLVFFLFKVRRGQSTTVGLVISVILCAVSIAILFISRDANDCLATDTFMMCVTAGFAWPIFGFSIGSWIIAYTK